MYSEELWEKDLSCIPEDLHQVFDNSKILTLKIELYLKLHSGLAASGYGYLIELTGCC